MRALLFGLFVGYFFVACAPVHWSSPRLWLVAGVLLTVIGLMRYVRKRDPTNFPPNRAFWGGVSTGHFAIGLLAAALFLGLAVQRVSASLGTVAQAPGCLDARLMMRVQIEGLPRTNPSGSRFDVRVLDVDPRHPHCGLLQGAKLRLGFRGPALFRPNQTLLAEIKLRPIRGSVSPGAFDHELHSALQGVALGGYISQLYALRDPNLRLPWLMPSIDEQRYAYRHYVTGLGLKYSGVILALASGDTAALSADDWQLLQNSGTVHLLVISGLHVGLVSALLFLLLRPVAQGIVGLMPGSRPAGLLHALLTVALLLLYVHWVGASVPALRAWLMVAVVLVGWALERRVQAHTLVLIAAVGVVAMTPLAGLQAGFWLSFALVAWLLNSSAGKSSRYQDQKEPWLPRALLKGRQLLGLHLGATLLLLPLLGWLGLPVAPVGPLANFFAVPYVTLLLVPLVLVSVVLSPLASALSDYLLSIADRLVALLFGALHWFVEFSPALSLSEFGVGALGCASALVLAVLMPLSGVMRTVAGSAVLIWLLQGGQNFLANAKQVPVTPEHGEFTVQVLDVGQGLSVLVGTTEAVILYDTGASFPSGFNYVDSVIAPALTRHKVDHLSAFVVSHSDNDHAGGAAAVIERFSPKRQAGAIPSIDSCRWHYGNQSSQRWLSAGVELRLMNFADGQTTNDRSCVLLIRGANAQALLAGDIEASAERALLAQFPSGVDLVSVAHHGSLTSSSEEFVQKLQPGLAVVSAGFRNRFGHPHAKVVKRYEAVGSKVVSTAIEGTIDWRSTDVGGITSARARRLINWQLAAPLAVALAESSPEDY